MPTPAYFRRRWKKVGRPGGQKCSLNGRSPIRFWEFPKIIYSYLLLPYEFERGNEVAEWLYYIFFPDDYYYRRHHRKKTESDCLVVTASTMRSSHSQGETLFRAGIYRSSLFLYLGSRQQQQRNLHERTWILTSPA